jgi:pseudaminic acid biosynthesis-associated methylase
VTESGNDTEAERLERLWAGDFGDDYVDRNAGSYDVRERYWVDRFEQTGCQSVLEVGCNVGGNLRWLAPLLPPGGTTGVDINRKALTTLHVNYPEIDALWSPARDLPFRDRRFDLVFSMGVLIHQPDTTLPLVMHEMVRCSRRWVLCGEYHAPTQEEISYRGHEGALFRRDYGSIFVELFPELKQQDSGFLGNDDGWDDVTWWLFERT